MTRVDDRHELLEKISISYVLQELVGPPKNRMWRCPSPDHAQTGKTPPVSVDEAKGVWNCHGCGAGGSAIDALVAARSITVADAFVQLRDLAGGRPREPDAHRDAHPDADAVLDEFCRRRSWRRQVIDACGLTAVRYRGHDRVRIPFRSGGRVLWYQDRLVRDVADPNVRKFHAPGGSSQQIWAVDLARALATAREQGTAFIVEGPTDGLALLHVADEGTVGDYVPAVFGLPGAQAASRLVERLSTALAGLDICVLVDSDDAGAKLRATLHAGLTSAAHVIDIHVPAGAGDVDGWRHLLDHDDDALLDAITEQIPGP